MRYDLRQLRARLEREEARHQAKVSELEEERASLVRSARRGGLSVRDIAAEVGISQRKVREILREGGSGDDR